MSSLYSRTVIVNTPKGQRTQLVTDSAFLSRSRASFMALDTLVQWHARKSMTVESVSDVTHATVTQREPVGV
jgi:hypothetical protein